MIIQFLSRPVLAFGGTGHAPDRHIQISNIFSVFLTGRHYNQFCTFWFITPSGVRTDLRHLSSQLHVPAISRGILFTQKQFIKDRPNKDIGRAGHAGRCTAVKNNAKSSPMQKHVTVSHILYLYETTNKGNLLLATNKSVGRSEYND